MTAPEDRPPVVTGAPERIWLVFGELEHDDTFAALRGEEVCWCEHRQFDADIEYVRADVVEQLRWALKLAVNAMCAPLDGWKGDVERVALDAARLALAGKARSPS